MIQDVKNYVSYYATIDEPIPYKNLFIYPILVKDYYNFVSCYDILCVEKNNINTENMQDKIKIIQMSYLDFIFEYLTQDNTIIDENLQYTVGKLNTEKLVMILFKCLHLDLDKIQIKYENKHYILVLNGIEINFQEFDEIRRIILYQNVYDYFDEYINPDFKKAVDDYYAIKNKGLVNPELEDKMSALTALTGILKKDMLNMTYREFENVFHTSMERMEYQINKTAELSGNVKFEKPIDHWVYKKKKNRYEDAFVSADAVKDKISSVNG